MTFKKLNQFIFAFIGSMGFFTVYPQNRNSELTEKLGMVSYTYRNDFAKDIPSTLDKVKANGITDMEFSNLFGKTAQELRKLLDEKGMKCSSFGVSYTDLVDKTAEVAQNAKILGASYVRVAVSLIKVHLHWKTLIAQLMILIVSGKYLKKSMV